MSPVLDRPSRCQIAVAAALLLAAATGCSPDSNVLARVGDRTITVKDFEEIARGNEGRYPGPPDSAKSVLLSDLVRRELILAEARLRGLDRDSLALLVRRNVEDQLLAKALFDRLAPPDVAVSDAEAKRLYGWRDSTAHLQILYTNDRAAAERARAAIDQGADFGLVSDRFSIAGLLPPGGDVGFIQPGSLVNPLDTYVHASPVGVVQGPMRAPGEGWFVLRVVERRAQAQRPYAEEASQLLEMLRQRKQRALSQRAYDMLRETYDVRPLPGGAQALFARFNAAENPLPPTPEERGHVLATWRETPGVTRDYTLGDALTDLEDAQRQPPNFRLLPAIQQWIESQVVRRAALAEARRRHLEEEPDVARQVRQRMESFLLDGLYQQEVTMKVDASPEEVLDFYRRNSASYDRLERARVLYATFPDPDSLAAVGRLLPASATLREAVARAGSRVQVTEEEIRFPAADPDWERMGRELLTLAPGQHAEPQRTREGFRLVQLVDKAQNPRRFEDLTVTQQQNVRNQALAERSEQRLDAFTAELRTKISPVEVHTERLQGIRWPIAPLAGGA